MSNVNLMHGDCLERMNEIPDGSVDMILADLPYGTTQCKWDVVIPFEPLWKHYWRVIKANGAVVLFGSEPFNYQLSISNPNLKRYSWYWKKEQGIGLGNVKFMPLKIIEEILVFYQKKPTYNPQMKIREKPLKIISSYKKSAKTLPWQNSQTFCRISTHTFPTTFLEFTRDRSKSLRGLHPTQKPVALLEYLIRTYTNEGETVLDNVMGSGSTGVACLNTQRKFIGIEKDATYFEIAKKRIGESLG